MLTTLGLLCLAAPAMQEPDTQAAAQEAAVATQSAEDAFDEIQDEFDDAMEAFNNAYRAADEAERTKVFEEHYPDPDEYAGRFMALAKQHPGSPTAAKALIWVAQRSRDDGHKSSAMDTLISDHIESPEMGKLCSLLQRDYKNGEAKLRRIMEASPHDSVKGQACFALGKLMMGLGDMSTTLQAGGEELAQQYAGYYGEEVIQTVLQSSPAELSKKAETILATAGEKYGDVPYRNTTLAAMSDRNLFQLRNLQIGMVAPDIEGEDIDGVKFKLSDYRGKVVVLDFWGHW